MKKVIFLIAPLLFLATSCASSGSSSSTQTQTPSESSSPTTTDKSVAYKTPENCTSTKILQAISPTISGAAVINTPWQPSPGTELFDFLNNGGIACSYGISSAEIGTTVKWVKEASELFSGRTTQWKNDGYELVDLANQDEQAAYFKFKPVSAKQEFQIWSLNILIGGMWIQIDATYLHDLNSAESLITAAIVSAAVSGN